MFLRVIARKAGLTVIPSLSHVLPKALPERQLLVGFQPRLQLEPTRYHPIDAREHGEGEGLPKNESDALFRRLNAFSKISSCIVREPSARRLHHANDAHRSFERMSRK